MKRPPGERTATRRNAIKAGLVGISGLVGVAGLGASTRSARADYMPPSGGGGGGSGSQSHADWVETKTFRNTIDSDDQWDAPLHLTTTGAAVTAEEAPSVLDAEYLVDVSYTGTNIIREEPDLPWGTPGTHASVREFGVKVSPTGGDELDPVAQNDFGSLDGGVSIGVSKFEDEMATELDVDIDAERDEVLQAVEDEGYDIDWDAASTLFGVASSLSSVAMKTTAPGRIFGGLSTVAGLFATANEISNPPPERIASENVAEYVYEYPQTPVEPDMDKWIQHVTVSGIGVEGDAIEVEPYIRSGGYNYDEFSFTETVDLDEIT